MNRKILSLCLALILLLCAGVAFTQDNGGPNAYQDLTHYSKVFGHEKYYRLYLPQGYAGASRRYPVIYFFHGWGGRHFKDDNAKLEYVKIKKLVDRYQVILVMWDGNVELSEPRPYNVGNHEDVKFQIQMKDYFPELVSYIDSSYRTLTDRGHRGIIGFSMGGFMSFFLAGKYPDRVSAAVSLAGSPEFFVGYPDNQELYPMRYAFPNLRDVATRMHNGNTDILYYLNSEVHAGALWDEKVNLEYWAFPGGHMIDRPGETVVFEKAMKFVMDAFKKQDGAGSPISGSPVAGSTAASSGDPHWPAATNGELQPAGWSHYDLYPDFSVWGYQVESDKHEPGFLNLDQVDKNGWRFCTRRWLPDGPSLDEVQVHITTAPLYTPNTVYGLATYRTVADAVTMSSVISDSAGRISVKSDGAGGATGIFTENETPEFVFLDYSTDPKTTAPGHRMLAVAANDQLFIRLFNRGGEVRDPRQIRVRLYTKDPSIRIKDSIVTITVLPGQRITALPPLTLSCSKTPPPHAEPADIRFHLAVNWSGKAVRAYSGNKPGKAGMDDRVASVSDEFIVPVFFKAAAFDSIRVDDGRQIRDTIIGEGNGDGITDAGERILLYQGDHRLRLYTDDPWVLPGRERLADEMIPARWPDGFTLSSVIQISPDCPDEHTIELLAHYETKAFNPIERKFTWGRVRLTVRHKPTTTRISMDDFFGVNAGNCAATPADLQKTASWIRDYSQWKWLQPEKDKYTFTDALGKMNYDAYYRQLDSLHIHSLFCVQQAPAWISSGKNEKDPNSYAPSGNENGLKPEHYKEAASFFYQLAARYGRRQVPDSSLLTKDRLSGLRLMDAIEVYNEPDGNWGNHVSMEQYAALLNAAYDGNGRKMKGAYGIKAADPNMLVSIGGLADNLGSLKKIVSYAGRAPFDIINAHYYTFQNIRESYRTYVPPEWSSLVPDMKEMVAWARVNAPGRPVWLTEIGWDTKPHSTEFVSEQEAANYLIRSYLLSLGAGIEKCFWFIFNDLDDTEKPGVFSSSGLFENESTPFTGPTHLKPKLTYWYDATFQHLLSGYYYDKDLSFPAGDSTIYQYRFVSADGKRQLDVCWYCPKFQFYFRPLSGQPSHVNFRFMMNDKDREVKKVVRPVAGSLEGAAQDFKSEDGGISLSLDGTPVFIETSKKQL